MNRVNISSQRVNVEARTTSEKAASIKAFNNRYRSSSTKKESKKPKEETVKSVSELGGWLNDFGQESRKHYKKVNDIGQTPEDIRLAKPKRTAIPVKPSFSASKQPIKRVISGDRGGPTMTPVRFKNRQKNELVKATDTKNASVKQLSKWLANDPTANKSERGTVRRGINVIMKARAFDKDLADIIVEDDLEEEEVDEKRQWERFESNDVQDKRQWLQQAFEARENQDELSGDAKEVQDKRELEQIFESEEAHYRPVMDSRDVGDKRGWLETAFEATEINTSLDFDNVSVLTEAVSVDDKKRWLTGAFEGERQADEMEEFERQSAVTELVSVQDKKKWLSSAFGASDKAMNCSYEVTESKSCASVNGKKEWLQTAFQKGSQEMVDAMKSESNDAATPAKKKWRERRRSSRNSERKTPEKINVEHDTYEPTTPYERRRYDRKISDISGSDHSGSTNLSTLRHDRRKCDNSDVEHSTLANRTSQRKNYDSFALRKPPTPVNAASKQPGFDDQPRSVIDSEASLDFKSARLLLASKRW